MKGYMSPANDIMLMEGDMFNTSFRGTPGMFGYFRLSTDADLLPMVEAPPIQQSYWAEALWGSGEYPDSLLVRGIYTGVMMLTEKQVSDSSQIEYYLCRKKLPKLNTKDKSFKQQLADCGCEKRANDATLAVMRSTLMLIGELTDSIQTIRTGPRKGYLINLSAAGTTFSHHRQIQQSFSRADSARHRRLDT